MKRRWLSKKEYDFIFSRAPRVCVDLVIKDRRGVLLTLRKIEPHKDRWHMPGGRVFFEETLAQAVARVAREEVGLNVKIKKFLGFMEFLREKQDGRVRHSVSLVFLLQPQDQGKVKSDWQAAKIRFFTAKPKRMNATHYNFLKQLKLL